MIFVGVDWAEAHHDLAVKDATGKTLARRRISDDLEGVRHLHEVLACYIDDPSEPLF